MVMAMEEEHHDDNIDDVNDRNDNQIFILMFQSKSLLIGKA
jgi:hypothetical protein